MSRFRYWLIGVLVLLAGFVSIGIFKPSDVISSRFVVQKSASTTFELLTDAANLNLYLEGIRTIEPLVEHSDKNGNTYKVTMVDAGKSDVDVTIMDFKDREQFTYQFSKPDMLIRSTYTLLPVENGTSVQVRLEVIPVGWWRKSLLPFFLWNVIEHQNRVEEALSSLISESTESIVGDWVAINPLGVDQMFSFQSDGVVDWKMAEGDEVFPIRNIRYERSSFVKPELLDLSGFTSGPLRGLTLFGILDMSRPDTMVFDAEAGLPDDDRVRPTGFSSSAVTYIRIR